MHTPTNHSSDAGNDTLARLAHTIESRKPGQPHSDPASSYVARMLQQGPDAFLKKIGEEATETVMAAKDIDWGGASAERNARLVGEVADLWFHSLIALAYYRLAPGDVLDELERRAGTSGIEEKALRKLQQRQAVENSDKPAAAV